MPVFILKECAAIFSSPITHLVNLTFTQAIFPPALKIGKVTPRKKKLVWMLMILIIIGQSLTFAQFQK